MFSKTLTLLSLFSYFNLALSDCPYGWFIGANWDSCFRINNQSMTWLSAETECVRQGGHLASIDSSYINYILQGNGVSTYWVGASSLYGKFRWSNGNNINYANWNSGQPSNATGANCVLVQSNGKWVTQSCAASFPSVCELSLQNEDCKICDDGWIFSTVTNKCYKQVSSVTSFQNARATCQQYQADLVSIHSFIENQAVSDVNNELNPMYGTWIGLLCSYGNCSWADGTPFDYGIFQSSVTPFNSLSTYCIIMIGNDNCENNYERWATWDCSEITSNPYNWPFLCQKDPIAGNTMKQNRQKQNKLMVAKSANKKIVYSKNGAKIN